MTCPVSSQASTASRISRPWSTTHTSSRSCWTAKAPLRWRRSRTRRESRYSSRSTTSDIGLLLELVSDRMPSRAPRARKQLQIRPWRESLDEVVHLHWLHRMKPSWRKDHGTDRFASSLRSAAPADDADLVRLADGVPHAEQRAAIATDLHPGDLRGVREAPRLNHAERLALMRVGPPEEQPRVVGDRGQRKPHDVGRAEHVVVLRGSAFAARQAIAEAPRRVGEDGAEGFTLHRRLQRVRAARASIRPGMSASSPRTPKPTLATLALRQSVHLDDLRARDW